MRQWEIFKVDLPNLGPHFVVIVSPDWVCGNRTIKAVNALLCATVRGGDRLSEFEVGLHDAEGFPFLTGCQCHAMLTIAKSDLKCCPQPERCRTCDAKRSNGR